MHLFFIIQHIKKFFISYACWLEKQITPGSSDFKKPYKYLKIHILFRYLLRILFFGTRVKISKKTLASLRYYLKKHQLIVTPTHTFIIEAVPVYELFGRLKQPFHLMIAREFFDLVLGLAQFPLKMAGCFSVVRGSRGASESVKFAKDLLKESAHPLVIFPEGESSLNTKSLLPLKKGAALLIQEAVDIEKPIAVLPMTFKITYHPDVINDFNWVLNELEWYLKLPRIETNYKTRIINLLEEMVDKDLGMLGESSSEGLVSKAKLLYQKIHFYLSEKYDLNTSEERAYEFKIKQLKSTKETRNDLALVYRWIEYKGIVNYLPDASEDNPATWAPLISKLLRIIYGDYGYESINRVIKHMTIEPILGNPIPVDLFKGKSVEEITEYLQSTLFDLNKINN